MFATASDDCDVRLYRVSTSEGEGQNGGGRGKGVGVLRGHLKGVTGLDWCLEPREWLASSSFDFTAQVWDAAKGTPLYSIRGHDGRVFSAKWSGQLAGTPVLYTGSDDQTVRCWDVRSCTSGAPPTAKQVDKVTSTVVKARKQAAKKKSAIDASYHHQGLTTSTPVGLSPSIAGGGGGGSGGGKGVNPKRGLMPMQAKATSVALDNRSSSTKFLLPESLFPRPEGASGEPPLREGGGGGGGSWDACWSLGDLATCVERERKGHLANGIP